MTHHFFSFIAPYECIPMYIQFFSLLSKLKLIAYRADVQQLNVKILKLLKLDFSRN